MGVFTIDCMHLEEKANLLKFRVKQYQKEKDELTQLIEGSRDERINILVNEINGYKNMTEKCRESCGKLTEEIVQLKNEIEKCYGTGRNSSMSRKKK
jgi:chromosome segregation ATPase